MNANQMRVWFGVFVLVVFVGGLGAGVLMTSWLQRPPAVLRGPEPPSPGAPRRGGPGGPADMAPERFLGRLSQELELTETQRDQLAQVFTRRREGLRALYADVRERFEQEQQAIRQEIEAILTPEQRERFGEIAPRGRGLRRGFPQGRPPVRRGPGGS